MVRTFESKIRRRTLPSSLYRTCEVMWPAKWRSKQSPPRQRHQAHRCGVWEQRRWEDEKFWMELSASHQWNLMSK
ncbi:hypothetical protein EYF80_011906 [Liparis tanakae]|uniref:Uncharacterized protein n=1 Tax=Liparis tanakae TaxID=230148 RepID=A0A4Z2IIQ0_9TELE|nr:hypothetical protein EYF80_011906 [Liparis tanakae]